MDPYATLELKENATHEEIRRQYRRLALLHHPDKVSPERRAEASVRFQEISRAYEILSDPARRRAWDETRSTEGHFQDPLEVFRSMWEMLEESGFLQSVAIPAVPETWGPESELAFRVFRAVPLAPSAAAAAAAAAADLETTVSRHLPPWAEATGGGAWVRQQGRALGQWAEAFLRRAQDPPPPARGVAPRRLVLRAPVMDIRAGARRRIRFERQRAEDGQTERATCVVPLRLPGVVLAGEGDRGGDLEIRIQPERQGPWLWSAPRDVVRTLGVADLPRLWREGGVLWAEGADLAVAVPAGHPTQTWRVPGQGLRGAEGEAPGHLYLVLVPGASGGEPPETAKRVRAEPCWPFPDLAEKIDSRDGPVVPDQV